MPSRNSINKPKDNIHRQRKKQSLSRKRQSRAHRGVTTVTNSSGSTEITAFVGPKGANSGVIANTVISKKKAKKVERNLKYAKARNNLLVDLQANKEEMEIDNDENIKMSKKEKEDELRNALWAVVEDSAAGTLKISAPIGEGTTLGGPFF